MQQAGYHHANMLAEQLRTTIDAQGTEMLAMLSDMTLQDNNPPIQELTPPPLPTKHSANSAAHTDVQLQILRILQDMQQNHVRPGRRNQAGRTGAGGRGPAQRTGAQHRRAPDDTTFSHRVTDKYCHTHRGYNHTSGKCTRKATGNEDAATMTNKLGGSNAFCTPAI